VSQIDVLFGGYADKAAALADPTLAAFVRDGAWDQSRVFDDAGAGIALWNSANDTTQTVAAPNGQSVAVQVHSYEPGYALIVSYGDGTITPGQINANAASLAPYKTNANCLLVADRDAFGAGNTGAFIYYAAPAIGSALAQWRLQPLPLMGAPYPLGNP
jgi:hypothetical protein